MTQRGSTVNTMNTLACCMKSNCASVRCNDIGLLALSTVNKTQSKTTTLLVRRMQIMVNTLHLKSRNTDKTWMEDRCTFPAYRASTQKRAQIVSGLNMLCAFSWTLNLHRIYRISLSFMTTKKQLFCAVTGGLLKVCNSFSPPQI